MPRAKGAVDAGRRRRGTKLEKTGTGAISLGTALAPEPIARPSPSKLAPGLYLVATPIGNLDDITLRALKALAVADAVLCEDTRVTAKLLARFAIAAKTIPYHDHNAERMRPKILERLRRGGALALVSDAGTPLLSDPGFKLARDAIAEGLPVTALPGASAALTALLLSGLAPDRFLFAGFLPAKAVARRRALVDIKAVDATLIFYEGASRLADSVADMAAVFGDRPAAVGRELTKLFEEVRRGSLRALAAHYAAAGAPKGEIVVVVAPPGGETVAEFDLDRALTDALGGKSLRQAVEEVAAASGLKRRQIYARALQLKVDN